jgi:hypothetical protein
MLKLAVKVAVFLFSQAFDDVEFEWTGIPSRMGQAQMQMRQLSLKDILGCADTADIDWFLFPDMAN